MRPFILASILAVFLISACLNCTLYGSVASIPYFGIALTEYAEKERDIFLLMYIAGGSILPKNEKVTDISLSLIRRSHEKAFGDTPLHTDPIGPYANSETLDLPALLIRILYWIPQAVLALLFLVLLLPQRPRLKEEELG